MDREYLTLEHIEKSFGGNRALKDVSFSVKKGTVHVLAGENGAGKSTVLKILCGNYHADSGEIYYQAEHTLSVFRATKKKELTCDLSQPVSASENAHLQ